MQTDDSARRLRGFFAKVAGAAAPRGLQCRSDLRGDSFSIFETFGPSLARRRPVGSGPESSITGRALDSRGLSVWRLFIIPFFAESDRLDMFHCHFQTGSRSPKASAIEVENRRRAAPSSRPSQRRIFLTPSSGDSADPTKPDVPGARTPLSSPTSSSWCAGDSRWRASSRHAAGRKQRFARRLSPGEVFSKWMEAGEFRRG